MKQVSGRSPNLRASCQNYPLWGNRAVRWWENTGHVRHHDSSVTWPGDASKTWIRGLVQSLQSSETSLVSLDAWANQFYFTLCRCDHLPPAHHAVPMLSQVFLNFNCKHLVLLVVTHFGEMVSNDIFGKWMSRLVTPGLGTITSCAVKTKCSVSGLCQSETESMQSTALSMWRLWQGNKDFSDFL